MLTVSFLPGLCVQLMFFVSCDVVVSSQVVCVNSFSQMLRRYTSLNHLAQAAHAVLQNSAHINQMLSDLNRVDFNNVQVCAAFPVLSAVFHRVLRLSTLSSGASILGVPV